MENILNLSIITLLIVAIIYAVILNYRLSSFKEGRKEIVKTIHSFNQVVQNAETTLFQLQKSTQNISEQLKVEVHKASLLRDDLVLLLDKNDARVKKNEIAQKTAVPFSYSFNKGNLVQRTEAGAVSSVGKIYQSDAEKELYLALERLKGQI